MTLIKGKVLSSAEVSLRYRKRHPGRHTKSCREYRRKKRLEAIAVLGGICTSCGFSDPRALQIDHINGGGTKEIKKIVGAYYSIKVIKSVLNKERKYQLLCANCNWIKADENSENNKNKIKIY